MTFASAGDVPPGNAILTQDGVGIVVKRGDPPPGSLDQTPGVQVLMRSGSSKGSVVTLGGIEVCVDLGPVEVEEVVPAAWVRVGN